MILRYGLIALSLFAFTAQAQETSTALPASALQDLIDAAAPGDEIAVPAGEYQGTIALREGITLRGAGEAVTILDGQGAQEVVVFGKEAALIGFTVRNGQVLASSKGNFIGIFECTFENFSRIGIMFDGGSGVVAHNIIRGNGSSVGIFCASANPLIINNLIENNRYGFQWVYQLIPTVIGNLFRNNHIAVYGPADGQIVLERNFFDGNHDVLNVGTLPASNRVGPVDAKEFILARGSPTSAYRDLMNNTYEKAVEDHAIIIYDLHQEPSVFDAITLFPWATFTVSASTLDTKIEAYEAYDWVADRALNAEFYLAGDTRPSVRVNNPDIVEKMRERYVLENRYVHAGSYYDDDSGRRIFKRMTNLSQIEIVIPDGYRVVSCAPECILKQNGSRPYLSIHDIGVTHIEVVLER